MMIVMIVVMIVGELIMNICVLLTAKNGSDINNIRVWKSTLNSVIAALVANFCIVSTSDIDMIAKYALIALSAFYLFVTLPVVIKMIRSGND